MSQNSTLRRRIQYRHRFSDKTLLPNNTYTVVIETFAADNFSARTGVKFQTDARGLLNQVRRSPPTYKYRRNEVMLPNGQCCSRYIRKLEQLKARQIKYLTSSSKRAGSCVTSGSNLIFAIDGSDRMTDEDFDAVKLTLKKLIENLKIESVAKIAEAKKRHLQRRKTLLKTPEILVYGIGLLIIQYSQEPRVHFPLLTKLTTKQVNRSLDNLRKIGGKVKLNRTLRYIEKKVINNHVSPTRNVVILITTSDSELPSISRREIIKKTGAKLITVMIEAGGTTATSSKIINSRFKKKYFKISNRSNLASDQLDRDLQKTICKATARSLKERVKTKKLERTKKRKTKSRKNF